MKLTFVAAATAALALAPALALGDPAPSGAVSCTPPTGPPPESTRPPPVGGAPVMPACATSRSKMCRKAEVDGYNATVSAYNQQVVQRNAASKAYVDALNSWEASVNAYAQCELKILNQDTQKGS